METKEIYYKLLKEDRGRTNEIALGEQMGLSENETQALIAILLSEHKIVFTNGDVCKYRIVKKSFKH